MEVTVAGDAGDCVSIFGKEPLEPGFLWTRQTNKERDSSDKINSLLRLSRDSLFFLFIYLLAEVLSVLLLLLRYRALLLCAWWRAWLRHHLLFLVISFIFSLERDQNLSKKKQKRKETQQAFSFSFWVFWSPVSSLWMRTHRRVSNACFSHLTILSLPGWYFYFLNKILIRPLLLICFKANSAPLHGVVNSA